MGSDVAEPGRSRARTCAIFSYRRTHLITSPPATSPRRPVSNPKQHRQLKGHTENRGGRVTLRSNNPRDWPQIDFNYFDDPHDVQVMPGSPEAEEFIGSLPAWMQDLVGSLQGAIYLGWQDEVYLVAGGC